MARNKSDQKSVILRRKKRVNGGESLYLDMYNPDGDKNHKHTYKFLKLYIEPVVGSVADRARIRKANREAETLAEEIRLKMVGDLSSGRLGVANINKAKGLLLVDWLERYAKMKAEAGRSKSTLLTLGNVVLHLKKFGASNKKLLDVDKDFCQKFLMYLSSAKTIGTDTPKWCEHHEKPMAKSTAQLYYNTFVTALNGAVLENYISVNPANKLSKDDKKPIRGEANRRGFLEKDEILKLIDTPCTNGVIKNAFLFSCFCGLRVSDVLTLKWKDIKSKEDGLFVSKKMVKTKHTVEVPLSAAERWLPDRGMKNDEDLVFNLPSYFNINYTIKKWVKSAGIEKDVTFHIARHSFATSLLTNGADIYTTSKLLGHENLRTTQIYADVIDRKKVAAVDALNKMLD